MALDTAPDRNPGLPWCRACKSLIGPGEPTTQVYFQTDPDGVKGLTGPYHRPCSKTFEALARVINLNPWSGF